MAAGVGAVPWSYDNNEGVRRRCCFALEKVGCCEEQFQIRGIMRLPVAGCVSTIVHEIIYNVKVLSRI